MVGFLGVFLLEPVAAVFEDVGRGEAGEGRGERFDRGGQPGRGGVEGAADEQGRLGDRGAVEGREVRPVAVHVAVAVQGAGQAGSLELRRVDVEIRLGEPGGEPPVGKRSRNFPPRVTKWGSGEPAAGMVSADRAA